MPDFLPFLGTRYRPAPDVSSVVAPPYDVIDEEERALLEAADPHNAVRLILPQATPPADPYQQAAATLRRWLDDGILALDPAAAFYLYRMRFADEAGTARRAVGVIGAMTLPSGKGEAVFPHEQTLPKARRDRLLLLRATRTNLDPIWCLSLADDLTRTLDSPAAPAATALDQGGTTHELVPVLDKSRVDAIRAQIAGAPLVLADGHHRFETAVTYHGDHPADRAASAIMTFVVPLDDAMLDVRAIHRLIHTSPPDLRARLAPDVDVEPLGPNTDAGVDTLQTAMRTEEALGLVDGDGLALLHLTPAALERVRDSQPVELRGVDAARFDTVIRPVLSGDLSYRDDARTVASIVAKGGAEAAVLLRPVTVEQIRAAAFAHIRMPAKTTFFWPKPRTGMVFRRLDDEPATPA